MSSSEFVYWIATTEGCVEEILRDHAQDGTTCRECAQRWPCTLRQRGLEAQALRTALTRRRDEAGPPEPRTLPLTTRDAGSGDRAGTGPDPAPTTTVSLCPGPGAPAGTRARWVHRRAADWAADPTGRERIARRHAAGPGGRCRRCPDEFWPCPFVVAALVAPLITPTGGAGISWFEDMVKDMDADPMTTDDEVFQAEQAFSAALDRHLDTHRYGGGYWVAGTAEAITAALLRGGWTPPPPPPGS